MTKSFVDPDLVSAVLDLRQGDHLCLLYDNDPAEQLPAILPFLRQGLSAGEQCIYVADDHTIDEFREALASYGVDVLTEEKRGSLLLWTRQDWRQPGDLDSARKAEQVRGLVDKALACGYKGIRFGVEMTWTLGPDIDAEKLRHWEATINTIFTPELPGRIICQYSRRRLSTEAIQAGICTHPVAVIGNEICPNPFYEGPLILRGNPYGTPSPAPEQVDWLISQLRWARAFDREREQRVRAEALAAEAERSRQLYEEVQAVTQQLRDSESDLRDFFDNGAVALHWAGPDGTILRANQAELDMLGYAIDEYVGHNIAEFHAAPAVIQDILARLNRGETLHEYEARLIGKDGSMRDVLIDSSVLWRDGEFVHTRCFTRDVTESSKANEAAFRLGAIVASSDDAIISKNLDSTITSWNAAAERIFGYTEEEAIGRSIRMIIPADRQGEEDEVLSRIRRGDRVEHFETVRQRKDGTFVDVSLTVSPVRDARGRIIGASKIARDISDRIEAEIAVQESIALKDQFLSLVSHELRTPISTILGNGQLLLRRGDLLAPEDKHQALEDVVGEAERLQRIIENLLVLSRMDAGRELRTEPIRLPRLVEEAIASFRRRSSRTVTLTIDEDVPIAIGEPGLVTQVIDNLMGNAEKYSAGDTAIEVAVKRSETGEPEVHVLDRGIGFGSEDADQLFTPFFRTKSAIQTAAGMGLGLAVCKRIIAAQEGQIGGRSRHGGGSEFWFSLPTA